MTIWFTSDHHFDHANFLTFKRADGTAIRPFSSVEEMNEVMIERWNAVVRPEDHVYHLGDVTMARGSYAGPQSQRCIRLVQRLRGHKRLVLGNHDHLPIRTYVEAGFQKIRGCWKGFAGMTLTHIPIHPDGLSARFPVNVHGHIHERLVLLAPPHPDPRYINLCVEQTAYYPITLEEIQQRIRKLT
jgi:calcineurin-like phosphoesterase family protein